MKCTFFVFLLLINITSFSQTNNLDSVEMPIRYAANQGLLDKYYPANIDTLYGGYLSTFDYAFQPKGEQDKMIVKQSRNVWSTAKAAMFYHDTSYISMSRHGFYFLKNKMWDSTYCGFSIWLIEMARQRASLNAA